MMSLRIPLVALFLFAACASPESPGDAPVEAPTQESADAAATADGVPAGWLVRTDDGSAPSVAAAEGTDVDIRFAVMEPGFHINMYRPRAIFWHPDSTASGDYRAAATMHLFDPGQRREAYGLIVGGSGLDGPDQEYLYFLVRRTGEFLIKVRRGSETETIVDWTAHDAVVPYNDETEGTATNTLEVETMGDMIHFRINGADVHASTDGSLPTDGHFGFRLNHGLEVHVETITASV